MSNMVKFSSILFPAPAVMVEVQSRFFVYFNGNPGEEIIPVPVVKFLLSQTSSRAGKRKYGD